MSTNEPLFLKCQDCPAWSSSVFSKLNPAELQDLYNNKTCQKYDLDSNFSEQDQAADEIYCISQGAAKVTWMSPDKKRKSIIRFAAVGDLLGYRCIFSNKKFRATASALMPTTACKIKKDYILKLISIQANFSLEILRRMGNEIAAAENHHHSFCHKNVRERIAEAIYQLGQKCGIKNSNGLKLEIYLSRKDLSNWIGAAKESVIRCLSDFKKEGLISQEGDHLVIKDQEKLKTIAGI